MQAKHVSAAVSARFIGPNFSNQFLRPRAEQLSENSLLDKSSSRESAKKRRALVVGDVTDDNRERSLRSGFNAHMTKPIEPRALLDLIEQL